MTIAGQTGKTFTPLRASIFHSNVGVNIPGALTNLIDIPCSGINRIFAHIVNSAGNAFTAFQIQAKTLESPAYIAIFTGGFAAPSGILIGTSGDLAALGAGATGWFFLDVTGIDTVRLAATKAAGTASVYVQGGSF